MRFHIGYSFKLKHLKWLFLALFGLLSFSGIFDLSKKELDLIPKVYAETNTDTYFNIEIYELPLQNGTIDENHNLKDFLDEYYGYSQETNDIGILFRYINNDNFSVKIINFNDSVSSFNIKPYVLKSVPREFRMLADPFTFSSKSELEIIKENGVLTILFGGNTYNSIDDVYWTWWDCYHDNICPTSSYSDLYIYGTNNTDISNNSSYSFTLNWFDYYYYYMPFPLIYQQQNNDNDYLVKEFRINDNVLTSFESPILTYCDVVDCSIGGGDNPGGETTIEDLENTILDNSPPDIPTFSDIEISSDSAISGLLLLPITLLQRLNNSIGGTCTPYTIPFGLTGGSETLTFPCIVLEDYLGSNLVQIIDLAICLFLVYEVAMLIISSFESITSLEDGFASLYTPRHVRPIGKHTKEVD